MKDKNETSFDVIQYLEIWVLGLVILQIDHTTQKK